MKQNFNRSNYLTQAWLVILLALLYGGALAGVQVGLGDRILENKRNETYDQIPHLLPGAMKEKTVEHEIHGPSGKRAIVYEARDARGNRLGWVLPGSGQGFADRIELLIGLDSQLATIHGLYVLDQKETPGLGNYITSAEKFLDQFSGVCTDPALMVVKSNPDPEHEIQALTGATISSESVSQIVNRTIDNLRQPIHNLTETAQQ
jgi:electron transport complex protein RnfG